MNDKLRDAAVLLAARAAFAASVMDEQGLPKTAQQLQEAVNSLNAVLSEFPVSYAEGGFATTPAEVKLEEARQANEDSIHNLRSALNMKCVQPDSMNSACRCCQRRWGRMFVANGGTDIQ
jgi:glycine cleavage system pyridoxal-binding protein P